MLGGGPYQCETCPKCGENDMWNGRCASCGYEKQDDEDAEDAAAGNAPGRMIDSLDGVYLDKLRYEDIRIVYATHGEERSVYQEQEDGGRRLIKFDYRKGYLTPIGDIDRDLWQQIAETLIMRNYEGWITDSLQEWYASHPPNDSGADMSWFFALKAHIHREFDRPGWIYYIPWNRLYRPAELQGKLFPTVVAPCCGVAGETTAELLRMEHREVSGYCPHCFRRTTLRILRDPGNSRRALVPEEDDGEAAELPRPSSNV